MLDYQEKNVMMLSISMLKMIYTDKFENKL
jgi:hypothetical protein